MRWCHLYSGWILSPGWKLWRQSNEHTQTFISSVILNLLKFTVNMNHSRLQPLPCHACVLHAEYVVFICHSLPLGCMDVPQTWGNGTKWSCTRIFKLQVKTKQNNKTNQTTTNFFFWINYPGHFDIGTKLTPKEEQLLSEGEVFVTFVF